jgi:hypothetical protein
VIAPINLVNLATPVQHVQRVRPVSRKPLPDDEEAKQQGRGRSSAKHAKPGRETISVTADNAAARSSSAVQAALTDLKLGD